jgi:hypothetical protein
MPQVVGADNFKDLLLSSKPSDVKKVLDVLPPEEKAAVVEAAGANPDDSAADQAKDVAKAAPEAKGLMYRVLTQLQENSKKTVDTASGSLGANIPGADLSGIPSTLPNTTNLVRGSATPEEWGRLKAANATPLKDMLAAQVMGGPMITGGAAPAPTPAVAPRPVQPAPPAPAEFRPTTSGTQEWADQPVGYRAAASTAVASSKQPGKGDIDKGSGGEGAPTSKDGTPGGEGTIAESLGFAQNESSIDRDLQAGLAELTRTRGLIAVIQGLGTMAAGFYGLHKGIDMSAVMQMKTPQFEAEEKALLERAKFRREQLVRDQEQKIRKTEFGEEKAQRREEIGSRESMNREDIKSREYIARLNAANAKELESMRNANQVALELSKRKFDKSQSIADAMKVNAESRNKAHIQLKSALQLADKADDPEEARTVAVQTFITQLAEANPDKYEELTAIADKAITDPNMIGLGGGETDPTKLMGLVSGVFKGAPMYFDRSAGTVLSGERTMAIGAAPTQMAQPQAQGPLDSNSAEGRALVASTIERYKREKNINATEAQVIRTLQSQGKLK